MVPNIPLSERTASPQHFSIKKLRLTAPGGGEHAEHLPAHLLTLVTVSLFALSPCTIDAPFYQRVALESQTEQSNL